MFIYLSMPTINEIIYYKLITEQVNMLINVSISNTNLPCSLSVENYTLPSLFLAGVCICCDVADFFDSI